MPHDGKDYSPVQHSIGEVWKDSAKARPWRLRTKTGDLGFLSQDHARRVARRLAN